MSTELVKVPFHGDVLEAVREDERVGVSLRRCCENLGVSVQGQLQKLKAKAWATVKESFMVAPDGKVRPLVTIDLDSLPLWLATIEPGKVKPEVREKLVIYQKEAARVLADHFFKRTPPDFRHDPSLVSMIETVVTRCIAALPRPAFSPVAATPSETVHERVIKKGWFCTSPEQRAEIRRLANHLLDLRHNETPDMRAGPGGPCRYYLHQIAVLDEAIDRVWEKYRRLDKQEGPGLFG